MTEFWEAFDQLVADAEEAPGSDYKAGFMAALDAVQDLREEFE